jgi:putative ABC transport system permease protein
MRFAGLFNKTGKDREFQEELDSHIQMHTEDNLRLGMTPAEARRQALIKMGGIESTRQDYREQRGLPLLETLLQDIRYGARMLRKNPGFTTVAVLTLALGIGANTAIFSVVNGVLLKPLAYQEPERLVTILLEGHNPVSAADFLDWRAQSQSFIGMAAAEFWDGTLTGGDRPESVPALRIGEGMFQLLGVPPLIGRTFQSDDFQPGKDHVLVLSHRLWQRRFGGNPNVVGQSLALNGETYLVAGVMPPQFQFAPFWATKAEFWAPLDLAARATQRDGHSLRVFARLKPGVTRAHAQAEMETIWRRLEKAYPDSDSGRTVQVDPLLEKVVGDIRPALLMLAGAVAFVLLIACANVANLLLVRGASRQKELAVRTALGASRGRTIRQLLTESVMLSTLGGVFGLLLGFWGVGMLKQMLAVQASGSGNAMPRMSNITVDTNALLFTFAVALVTGLVFGLAPALRGAATELHGTLKTSGRGATEGRGGRTLRNVLVVSEIALALVTLVGAGLMLRSFAQLEAVDSGLAPDKVLSFTVSLHGQADLIGAKREAFYQQLLQRISALPGVASASAVNHLPLAGDVWDRGLLIEGKPKPNPQTNPGIDAVYRVCRPGYFQTTGIVMEHGRDFTEQDRLETPGVVVINEKLAREGWPGEDPVGKRISFDEKDVAGKWLTVVGVIRNVKQRWSDEVRDEIYLPFQQSPFLSDPAGHYSSMTLVMHTSISPLGLSEAVRSAVQSVNPNAPVSSLTTLEQVISDAVRQPRFNLVLVSLFAVLALTLAAVGIYGVMAYTVTQRTQEIGIRMALGALNGDVLKLVLRQGMGLALLGIILGVIGALGLTRLMTSLLYQVKPGDPVTFVCVSAVLVVVSLMACWLPARRAARVAPMVALRNE